MGFQSDKDADKFIEDNSELIDELLGDNTDSGERAGYILAPRMMESGKFGSVEELLLATVSAGVEPDDEDTPEEALFTLYVAAGIIRWCFDHRYGGRTN